MGARQSPGRPPRWSIPGLACPLRPKSGPAMAPIFVKTTSGSYEIDAAASSTIAEFLEKAKAKHKQPSWADDVLLKLEGGDEDVAEDKSKTLESMGIGGGTQLVMKYYQHVLPSKAKELKKEGILPGGPKPFIMKK